MRVTIIQRLRKIRLIPLLIGMSVIALPYYYFVVRDTSSSDTKTASTQTAIVATGSLKETIDAVGTAQLVDEQSLKFNQLGTITKVNFKAGDTVKKGDIIAKIDDSDGEASVKDAQISLENAKLAYQELFKDPDQSQILSSKNNISSTKSSLEIAQSELANLKKTQADDLNDAQANIDNTEKDLENLVASQAQTIKDAEQNISNQQADIDTAQKSLDLAQKDYDYSKKQLENDLGNKISNKSSTVQQIEDSFGSELTAMGKIVEQLDYILGVSEENKKKNDTFEMYLGAKNSQVLNQAETSLTQAMKTYADVKSLVNAYDESGEKAKMLTVLNGFKDLYKILDTTSDYTYQAVDASVSTSDFTESDIENKKTLVFGYRTSVQSKLASTTSTINTLNTLSDTDLVAESNSNSLQSKLDSIGTSKTSIAKKQADLESAKSNLELTQKSQKLALEKKEQELQTQKNNYDALVKSQTLALESKAQAITNQQNTLGVNKLSYNELLDGPTAENIAKANNSIEQAELKVKNAQENLDDYNLIAPFDGVVRKIDYMVGDNLTSDSEKYVYIENPNLLEITVNLDQVDIAKVAIDTEATVTFDAYPSIDVKAKISSIDTTPVQTSGVTTYTVTLVLDDATFDKKVLSGMTADVEIIASQKKDVLTVSTQAIITKDEKTYLNVKKNGAFVQTPVEIGIAADGKTEITSGAHAGDTVEIQEVTSTSTTTSGASSSFGGGPPGGF